eukprot:TRINITY_DN19142_c0_g1_i1.p1 TRINITY_DN19142_c0_g1~~TRINITY_DN19142_c0_g1_i1.p1  ORF type:complete len:408 (-),score=25.06 TRINITY_DN19142_c0_g1_i1:152-1213(-)
MNMLIDAGQSGSSPNNAETGAVESGSSSSSAESDSESSVYGFKQNPLNKCFWSGCVFCGFVGLTAGSIYVCMVGSLLKGPGFLIGTSFILLSAAAAADSGKALGSRPCLPIGAASIACAGTVLMSLIVVRLFYTQAFGGDPARLDFGLKCSQKKGCAPNVAFELEFNSFGHASQGLLAILLFPVMEDSLLGASVYLGIAGRLSTLGIAIYPVYNFLKRLLLHRETFATCSFWNNGMEWGFGLIIGLCLGVLCTGLGGNLDPQRHLNSRMRAKAIWQQLEKARIFAGALIGLVAVGATVLLIMMWGMPLMPWESGSEPQPVAFTDVIFVWLVPFAIAVVLACVVKSLSLVQGLS